MGNVWAETHGAWLDMQADAAPTDYRELSSGRRRARKWQKCSHNHTIVPGQYYGYQVYISDGEFVYYKTCDRCDQEMQDIIEGRA